MIGEGIGCDSRCCAVVRTVATWRPVAAGVLLIAGVALAAGVVRADNGTSLLDALAGLREQGYQIIYSDDLVTTSQRIDVAAIDLDQVQAALGRIGLTLSRRGDIWLVVRNHDVPPSLTLHIVSTSGEAIAAAEFQFGRKGERTYVNGANGRFLVTWPANTVDAITIRARDHYPRTLPLSEVDRTIVLQPIEQIENVIVTGSRHLVPATIGLGSATSITADEMTGVPALAGDSMRITDRCRACRRSASQPSRWCAAVCRTRP